MRHLRPTLVAAGLVVLLARSLSAQAEAALSTGPAIDTTADVLVLDYDFAAAGEFVRIFLQSKQVYRAELSAPDLQPASTNRRQVLSARQKPHIVSGARQQRTVQSAGAACANDRNLHGSSV